MAFAHARYGVLLRSIPVAMAGKFSATMTAEALVAFAAAWYLGWDTKVSWPGPACSMPATQEILVSGEALSMRALREVAMSASFIAVSRGIVAIRSQVLGVRCQVSGKTRSTHFTVNPRALFLRPNTLLKMYFPCRSLTAAAKADSGNKPSIAAVNRCATQNQVQHRLFPQPAKT